MSIALERDELGVFMCICGHWKGGFIKLTSKSWWKGMTERQRRRTLCWELRKVEGEVRNWMSDVLAFPSFLQSFIAVMNERGSDGKLKVARMRERWEVYCQQTCWWYYQQPLLWKDESSSTGHPISDILCSFTRHSYKLHAHIAMVITVLMTRAWKETLDTHWTRIHELTRNNNERRNNHWWIKCHVDRKNSAIECTICSHFTFLISIL